MKRMLKEIREMSGMTQAEIAKLAGISERGYQNYELGIRTPNIDTAISIAKALKCDVEKVFKKVENEQGGK